MQKHVNLVDLAKSFPTSIYLQNLASIQKRTSLVKFAHLAEKSGKGSITNLSTKAHTLLLLDDGSALACGLNGNGQCDVPALLARPPRGDVAPDALRYT